MSLRLRWILTLLGFAVLVVAVIAALHNSGDTSQSGAALLRADHRTRLFIARDQAPRSSVLPIGARPRRALEDALEADLRGRIGSGQLQGPVEGVKCTRPTPPRRGQLRFHCIARAADFPYPYRAVVDRPLSRMTWCKFDPSPGGEGAVPVSPKCKW